MADWGWSVRGFRAAGVASGIKPDGSLDLALIVSDVPCAAAAVFTQNAFAAAPVIYDRELMDVAADRIQAVVVNSGNANACTGTQGLADAAAMARATEEALGLPERRAFVMSTGVIGVPLPIERIQHALPAAVQRLRPEGWEEAARAIMTTDTRPKGCVQPLAEPLAPAVIGGIAKGAGMIHPNMATMLAVIATDAAVAPQPLQEALRVAVAQSFHRITVDGDTSTNDTVVLLANGLAGNAAIESTDDPRWHLFCESLTQVCVSLAQQIVRDGEGATKFITIHVRGARDEADALRAAKAIANSPLCKTAFYGGDANWGRILAAVGYSGAYVDPQRVALWFAGGKDGEKGAALQVVAGGTPTDYEEEAAATIFAQPEIDVIVDLGVGSAEAVVWTCDLSHEYVTINAAYRT